MGRCANRVARQHVLRASFGHPGFWQRNLRVFANCTVDLTVDGRGDDDSKAKQNTADDDCEGGILIIFNFFS